MSDIVTSKEVVNEDDERIVNSLWKLFDEADIIIAHNGGNFDIPNMNTRFIVNKLPPPSAYQMIDTLKVARKGFGFTIIPQALAQSIWYPEGKNFENFILGYGKSCKRG